MADLSISDRLAHHGIVHRPTKFHELTGKHELWRANGERLGEFTAWEAAEQFLTPWERNRIAIGKDERQ